MKKKTESPFEQYRQTLSEQDRGALADYFSELDAHLALARAAKARLRADFENALLYYAGAGVPLETALLRLDAEHLGGFYVRPATRWYALDDAAKVYPLSMRHGQMAVFRLSVYLRVPVVPALLQIALTFAIKRFPGFATTVKKGFFWHYLDTAKRRYAAEEETEPPCRPLPVSRSGSQSFRLLYYRSRISVEYFHILTDGTGGMVFLKTLTAEYLRLLGTETVRDAEILDVDDAPSADETANEFSRADKTVKKSGFVDRAAVQMSGKLSRIKPCRILHYQMDAAALRTAARDRGATVTAYLLSRMFMAGKYATDEREGEMSIQVPVNMRKFYPSATLRNFSMYCGVRLPFDALTGGDDILEEITRQLGQKASKASMSEMMNSTERMVSAVRYAPLAVKQPIVRLVYSFLGDNLFTSTLSNLGVVTMPPELEKQLDGMDFVLGTAYLNRASCALVTFGGTATLSISKMTADPSFEEKLLGLLRADGVETAVQGSELYES